MNILLNRLILISQSHEIDFKVFTCKMVVKFIFSKTDSNYSKTREDFGFLLRVGRFLNATFAKHLIFTFQNIEFDVLCLTRK